MAGGQWSSVRRQATLFLGSNPAIESVRRRFNPVQASLIEPHVTLIREDEVDDWTELARKIRSIRLEKISILFSAPRRDGDLVWCPGSEEEFDSLRSRLLTSPRKQTPHLTLIHPRNGKCDDAMFGEIVSLVTSFEYEFDSIAFIEQRDAGPWRIIDEFQLQ